MALHSVFELIIIFKKFFTSTQIEEYRINFIIADKYYFVGIRCHVNVMVEKIFVRHLKNSGYTTSYIRTKIEVPECFSKNY